MNRERSTSVQCGKCRGEFSFTCAYLVIDYDAVLESGCMCIEQASDEDVAFLCFLCANCLRSLGVEPDGLPNVEQCIKEMDAMEGKKSKLQ